MACGHRAPFAFVAIQSYSARVTQDRRVKGQTPQVRQGLIADNHLALMTSLEILKGALARHVLDACAV
jgi:hypothetical protein